MFRDQLDEPRLEALLSEAYNSEADKQRQLLQECVYRSKAPQPWYFIYLGHCVASALVFRLPAVAKRHVPEATSKFKCGRRQYDFLAPTQELSD